MSATQYRVYLTPLSSEGVYGTEVEITDYVEVDGASSVTRSIDSTDYDVGVFVFDDVTLACDGSDGYLADETDSRSIFRYKRDLAKIRIVFDNGTATTTFRGYINEEGTRVNLMTDEITLLVFSHDSVLRKKKVTAGSVGDGTSFKNAIIGALNNAGLAGFLTINSANINVGFNGTVDDGAKFDNKQLDEALDSLLLVSNSVLFIDSSDTVFVKSRWQSTNPVLNLYGKGDDQARENIISVENYNTGLHRCFNSIRLTGGQPSVTVSGQTVTKPAPVVEVNDATSIALYGLRQKAVTLEFLNTSASLTSVANALLLEFRYPKIELEVTVATELVQAQSPATDLLDQVSVSFPLQVTARPPGKFIPVAGIDTAGDTNALLPQVRGAATIDSSIAFKVIEVSEDSSAFTTKLKLRQVGISKIDGVFNVPLSVVTKTADYSMTTSDDIVLSDATAAARTITLPDPTLAPIKEYTVKKIGTGTNAVSLSPNGSEKIDGNSGSYSIAELNQWVTVVSDGANWRIVGAG